MNIASLILSTIATVVSLAVTLRDKLNQRFKQSTSVISFVTAYGNGGDDTYAMLECVTKNCSSIDFAITNAHLWIEAKQPIRPDGSKRKIREDYYAIIPSFVMWSETGQTQNVDHKTTALPILVPANSAVHYRLAISMPGIDIPLAFHDGIKVTLATTRKKKSIILENQVLTSKLQRLETYMFGLPTTKPGRN